MITSANIKPVVWIGSTRVDLASFPEDVKDAIGYALYIAQRGGKHPDAKPLRGFGGAGILEIVEDHAGDTYRAVYTVRLAGRIYVLHMFQKKSKAGIKTPKAEIEANQIASQASRRRTRQMGRGSEGADMSKRIEVEEGSGNVFADMGLPNPEERLAKADLAIRISEAIRTRRLTQTRAAHMLGIDQPKISRLLRGQLSGFSTERLMYFLTVLGRDVEITVKPAPRSRRQGHLRVVATV